MNNETYTIPKQSDADKEPLRFTRLAKAIGAIAGVAASIGAGFGVGEMVDTDFHGEKVVTIDENTVSDIAKNEVDGGASHTGATVDKIVEMNPDVFQDSKAFVESEDIGQEITIPKSVE